MQPLSRATIPKFASSRFVRITLYILVIAFSLFLLATQVGISRSDLYFDEQGYVRLADLIRAQGFRYYADDLRTFGYPLFLALIGTILPQAPFISAVIVVQFLLHCLTAFLATACLERLVSPRKLPWGVKWLCFALVQLAPPILKLTGYLLTDSLSVVLFTLLVYACVTPSRLRVFWVSLVLALAIVVRPFYQIWSLIFVGVVIVLYLLSRGIEALQTHQPLSFGGLRRTGAFRSILLATLPLLLIVGLQYFFTYRQEQRIDLVGTRANEGGDFHLSVSTYEVKYETYIGSSDHSAGVIYMLQANKQLVDQLIVDTGSSSPLSFLIHYPLQAVYTYVLKTVGFFQDYEWRVFRLTLDHPVNDVFLYGLVFLTLFVFVNLSFLMAIRPNLRDVVHWPPLSVILLIAIDLHIFLYSIPTRPETRYIVPTFPILVSLALSLLVTKRNWKTLGATILISAGLYLWAYQVMISAMT